MDAKTESLQRLVNQDKDNAAARRALANAKQRTAPKVRTYFPYGGCRIRGDFVKQTEKSIMYRDSDGKVRRLSKTIKSQAARMSPPTPHIEPCHNCPDVRHPDACIHGRTGFCETCACM